MAMATGRVLVIRRLRCDNQRLPPDSCRTARFSGALQAVYRWCYRGGAGRNRCNRPDRKSPRADAGGVWYKQIAGPSSGRCSFVNRILQETARVLLASPSIRSPHVIPLLTDLSLAELVRLTVNTGNWITTRSAIVTGPLSLYNQAQTQKK